MALIPNRAALLVGVALLLGAPAFAQDPGVRSTPLGVQVDFQDADLRVVLTALAEAGGLNVSFSDLPQKRVTVRLTQPVARENILPLMRSLAQSNGLHVREEAGFLRIEASTSPAGTSPDGEGRSEEGAAGGGPRLFVYRLKHAKAERLAGTLQSLYGGRVRPGSGGGADRRPRTLSENLRDQRMPARPDVPEGPVRVDTLPSRDSSLPGEVQGEIQIVADEATNSLLVKAAAGDWAVVRQAIDLLDLRPLQVLIEGLIAEVNRSDDMELGVNVNGRSNPSRRTPFGGGLGLPTDSVSGAAGSVVLRVMHIGGLDINATVSALASGGRARVLSRPVILAQNNLESKILVGSQRPFVQVARSLPTESSVRDQVVQYRDVGTSLTITPTINPDGYVSLQLSQEVSNVTGEVSFQAPVISTRETTTHLFVRDGQTVVIGGLMDWQQDRSRSGIPYLRDIPILGALFGSTRHESHNNEIFLFLTPHIIRSDDDADELRGRVETRSTVLSNPERDRSVLVAPVTAAPAQAAPPPAAPASPPQP